MTEVRASGRAGPGSRLRWSGAFAVALVVLFLVSSYVPGVAGVGSAAAPPLASLHPSPVAPSGRYGGASPSMLVRPSFTCPTTTEEYQWVQGSDYTLAPPYPNAVNLTCALADPQPPLSYAFHDEVHASFDSSVPGSAARVEFPLILPPDNVSGGIQSIFDGFDLGMVVSGDARSIYNQSYAEVSFLGNTSSASYDVVVSVWSARLSGGCPSTAAYEFTWNNSVSSSFACMENLLGGGSGQLLAYGVEGGHQLNVTFVGNASGTSPLRIYVNDSYQSLHDSVILNNTTTGAGNLRPAFRAACSLYCALNWSSEPMGVSFGADLCDYSAPYSCYSYTESTLNSTDPVVLDPPTYFNGTAYSGQFAEFSPMSLTGACASSPISGILCPLGPTTGYYPEFTFNGSQLNFPTQKPWATQNFGGRNQYQTTGYPTAFVPLFLTSLTNSSRGGFVAPSTGLNVTVLGQVLGNISKVSVAYTLPDGSGGNATMNRTNGTLSNGYYRGSIPATGGDGKISYRVWATDSAGEVIGLPAPGLKTMFVQRETIPTFSVSVTINAGSCGAIVLNGTRYTNGQTAAIEAGTYPLSAQLCYPWVFGHWTASAGITVPSGARGEITITANGSLEGFWRYIRPTDTLSLAIANPPSGCGTIVLNGTSYSFATSVPLLDDENYTLDEQACALSSFSGWTVSNSSTIAILGSVLYLQGNGTITANYLPSSQAITLDFQVQPASCPGGGILFRGAGYVNNSNVSVAPGTPYPIEQLPCVDYGFRTFEVTPGISISAGAITVQQTGTVTEINYPLKLVTVITVPGFCGGIRWIGGAYNGTYGNDTVLNATGISNATAYPVSCAGFYPTGLSGSGGIQVTGNRVAIQGSGFLIATFGKGTPKTWVGFVTNPAHCGEILFGGVPYADTQSTYVAPDTSWSLGAIPCAGEGFVGWSTIGLGIQITGSNTAFVSGPGSITAIFHPLAVAYLYTLPSRCGTISLNGANYTNGATATIPENAPVPLRATACNGYGFSGWQNTTDALLGPGTLTLEGSGILTALFSPLKYQLTFLVTPAACGGVLFQGAEYFNNSSVELIQGNYAVDPTGCAGDYLTGWNSSAGVVVGGGATEVNLTGSGWVEFLFGPVPPVVTLQAPSGSYTNSQVPFQANVATPVPPYTYTYTWNFGDGSSAVTPANFTSHDYTHPGVFEVRLVVKDPYGRLAYSNTTLSVSTAPPFTNFAFPTLAVGVLLLGLAALVAAVLFARRRRGSSPGEPPASASPGASMASMDEPSTGPANLQEEPRLGISAPTEETPNPEEHV